MSKIGILGGTFDPFHNGHLELAKRAYSDFGLDKILVMVSKNPPHKKNKIVSDVTHRTNMVKIAIKDYSYMEFSDFELKRDGYIYTADTLTLLCNENPNTEYYFIIGGDSLKDFHKWYHPEIVLEKAVILAAMRPDVSKDEYSIAKDNLYSMYKESNPDIRELLMEEIDISSSQIRKEFYQKDFSNMMNLDVMKYISDNRLYLW